MTRRKTSPQKKETVLSPKSYKIRITIQCQKPNSETLIQQLVALEKSIKDSRDFMTAEFRANQAEIKNQLNDMRSKLKVLTTRVNKVEERVSDTEDKLMVKRETEENKRKTIKRS